MVEELPEIILINKVTSASVDRHHENLHGGARQSKRKRERGSDSAESYGERDEVSRQREREKGIRRCGARVIHEAA